MMWSWWRKTDKVVADSQPHEVMVVSVQPLSASLAAAVEESHEKPKEVCLASLGLTADKRLVGALDSACNRTCTGPEWLNGYLKSLQNAPEAIKSLVKTRQERETFRFGNGGTKVSLERWRLPTVIGGQVLCFWTSLVQVPSLGLLLGRDFLEAVGGDLSFLRRELRCERLDGKPIPLKQLTAGHYLLPLVPSSWPEVGNLRWRRLGPEGAVELQTNAGSWLGHCLNGSNVARAHVHDHMLTEKSIEVGNLVCAVMTSPSLAPVVQAPDMRSSLERVPTSTSCTTWRSSRTTSSPTTLSEEGHGTKEQAKRKQLAPLCSSASRKSSLGGKRRAPVEGPTCVGCPFRILRRAQWKGGCSKPAIRLSAKLTVERLSRSR